MLAPSQVYSHGLRVIMKGQPPQEWRAPGKKQIEKACANERQVVLALAGGEIIFFELDDAMQNIQASVAATRNGQPFGVALVLVGLFGDARGTLFFLVLFSELGYGVLFFSELFSDSV